MRIALVTDGIWPYVVGGMQRHSYYLCKYLAKAGVYTDLYYTLKNNVEKVDLKENFSAQEQQFITPYLVEYPKGPYFPGHYIWKSYKYSKALYGMLAERIHEYDLFYVQGFSGWYLLKEKSSSNRKMPPVILNFHGLEMFQNAASAKTRFEQYLFRPFTKIQLKRADYVQSLGGKLSKILLRAGLRQGQILDWPNAIESEWLTNNVDGASRPRKLAYVGRFERRKGIPELSSALSRLINDGYEFEMHFIGPIPSEVQIRDRKVHYHGQLKDDALIKSLLDEMDYLVVPSYAEGMPTVILEAMARSCSIIASDVGAVSTMVSNQNGFLLQSVDIDVLYNTMRKAIEIGDAELELKKESALTTVREHYLWENVSMRMIEGFAEISKASGSAVV